MNKYKNTWKNMDKIYVATLLHRTKMFSIIHQINKYYEMCNTAFLQQAIGFEQSCFWNILLLILSVVPSDIKFIDSQSTRKIYKNIHPTDMIKMF